MRRYAPALALCLLFCCKDRSEDEAARARIFSPEQPVGAAAEAKEPIDARKLADDPDLARRVLHMPQSEIEARLGARKAQQRVQFAWFRGPGLPDGGSEVSLAEETTLQQASNGDFSVRLTNDHNQGLELVWSKGEVFVKSLYGPFHKRRTDRTDVSRVREQAMSGLATFDRLARGLKLKYLGDTTVDGRRAVRYGVAAFGIRVGEKEKSDLPAVQYPDTPAKTPGPDPDTARRLELWEKEEPASVSGTLVVDAETAAPLAADLQGRFRVPSSGGAGPAAELALHSVLVTSAIGKNPGLKQPHAEPEPSVPHAVKDPLRFLRKEPGAPPPAEETEEDEGEEEQAPAAPAPAPTPKAQAPKR